MSNQHGEQKQQPFPAMIGGSSLLVIFAVLCLMVFALLSLSTVLADKRLTDASVEAVAAYYEADCQAEEIFAQLRAGQTAAAGTDTVSAMWDGQTAMGDRWQLPPGVTCSDNIYQYTCPISETQTLWVALKRDGQTWTVLRWQAVARSQLQEQQLEVWDGTTSS